MKSYSSKEVLRILYKDGWFIVDQRGSHIQLEHPLKPGKVTVPHPRKSYKQKTLNAIMKQAGIEIK